MKESYKEGIANHFGLKPYAVDGNIGGVALGRGNAGQLLSSEISTFACRSYPVREKATSSLPLLAKVDDGRGGVTEVSACVDIPSARTGISHWFPHGNVAYHGDVERTANLSEGTADMNADGKSDEPIVPTTLANKGSAELSAEPSEESGSTKRNAVQKALPRTPGRIKRKSRGLHGVREAARKDSTLKFTALLHHVNEGCLTEAFFNLKKSAAVGIDGVSWHDYEQDMEANIADLHDRIHRGAYRAKPSRRVWIPKPDGRQRPLGVAALEDKIVQQAVLWVLQSIYEQDFLGFSYGYRPGRKPHDALDALSVAIESKKVNWILDADVEGYFDSIDHSWLVEFLEHRIGDRRILRLIRKWLHAGVIEDGEWSKAETGSPPTHLQCVPVGDFTATE